VARRILAHLSYRVDVATNGLEALEAMAGTDYAAVLMDCEMPQMDGYAATAEIRRREGDRRHTPIIAMTASDSSAHRERCMDAGMDDYIVKPAQSADLDVVLAKWVGSLAPPGDQT